MTATARRSLALLLATTLALPAPAQEPTPAPPPGAPQQRDPAKVEPLTQWPALKQSEADRVRALVKQFRKAEELHADAHRQLVALGVGAVPILMQQVSDRGDNVNDAVFAVLDELIEAPQASLLVREAQKPKVELRRYLTGRLCRFDDPSLLPAFRAWVDDPDPRTSLHASMFLLAMKQKEGLEPVLVAARKQWAEIAPLAAEVLPRARSAESAQWVFARIAQAPPVERMAGLRLLRHLMVRDQAVMLRTYLQASDHTVLREAVNVARTLHDEPPVDDLPVFQVIEMSKQWLQKL